jgi:hypothetical protein
MGHVMPQAPLQSVLIIFTEREAFHRVHTTDYAHVNRALFSSARCSARLPLLSIELCTIVNRHLVSRVMAKARARAQRLVPRVMKVVGASDTNMLITKKSGDVLNVCG